MHLPIYFEISLSSNTALGFYLLGVTITIDIHKNIHSIFDGLQNEREWVTNMTNLHHRPHRQFSDKVLVGMSFLKKGSIFAVLELSKVYIKCNDMSYFRCYLLNYITIG